MIRFPAAAAFVIACSVAIAADPPKWVPPPGALGEARERLNKGNYAEARAKYENLAKEEATRIPATIGLARGWRAEGDYTKADSLLTDALKAAPNAADLLAERADLRFSLGRWDDAKADAAAAMKIKNEHLLARWTLARVARDKGELADADQGVRWIVRYYSRRSQEDNDIVDPDELLIVAQAGAENARWHRITRQFSVVLNEVIKDALKSDPKLWAAESFAGSLLLEKYNRPDALEAFDKALEINPKAADALVGKGRAAMQKYEVKDADQFADDALKINPKHIGALTLKADVHLTAGDFPGAEKQLLAARSINPRDAIVLGKLAACYTLLGKPDASAAVVKDAESFDAKPALFYSEMAAVLEDRKKYTLAKQYFLKSAAFRPELPAAPLALGLLAMRLGQEADAKVILTKAFEADAFNVRARNSLEVLKHLEKYQTITTDHYILRFDEKTDKLLAGIVAEYLEEMHGELKRQFQFEPPGRTLVQLFNSHEMFSGRVVGLPDLHTIGACTGPIFAMASPRARGVKKPFNWGRVVRHELTHVFNLVQTDFQCPHWLTEGLAVRNEQMARPPQWTRVLRDRYKANDLFDLNTIMFGFVRPRGPDEWALAYCQSQIYVEYLVKTHGEGAIAKLLAAYQHGMETPAAISTACGVTVEQFEKGYREHVAEIVKPLLAGKGPDAVEAAMTFAELEKAHEDNPDDLEIAARYAEQLARRNKPVDARKLADKILDKSKGHPVASLVKARLLMRSGDDAAARDLIDSAVKAHPDDARLLFTAAVLFLEAKETEKAATLLERGRSIAPLEADWHGQLVRLYSETNETDKLLDVLREVVSGDPDELVGRMKLARAASAAGKHDMAERYVREASQIDITNPDVQSLLIDVLTAAGKAEAAAKWKARFSPASP